jgi:dihydrofolate synthase / folylpolyglutamate synthase
VIGPFSETSYEKLIGKLLQESLAQQLCPDLTRVHKLSYLLGAPEKSYLTVHVAGSNGKGSVATKIAAGLQLGGYKTALYTSPHLFSVQERMQINGQMISQESLFFILSSLYKLVDKEEGKLKLTFFDIMTFAAFSWFSQEEVDVAVIETGLGGELDATNVIVPVLSVITSISLEHTDRLGSTEESIAQAKAGIIKPNVPIVIGPRAKYQAIEKKAKLCRSPLLITESVGGWYDTENSNIAKRSLEVLKADFPNIPTDCTQALLKRPPCRFAKHGNVLLDVAHNLEGSYHLLQAI